MIRQLRDGLAAFGRTFTRATDLGPVQQWLSGQDVEDVYIQDRRLSDPYLQSVFCFRCVSIIGMALARVPWELVDDATDQVDEADPMNDWLEQPNATDTWPWFVRRVVMFTLASGNGDLRIGQVSPLTGLPRELVPEPPGILMPDRQRGELRNLDAWIYRPPGGRPDRLPPDSVLRIQYAPTADPWQGIGPLTVARLAAETDYSAAVYNKSQLANGGQPAGIVKLKTQTFITPEQRALYKDEWQQMLAGPKNAGRIAMLTGDMDYQALGWSPRDMEFLATRRWDREEIATAFDVPLSYVNGQQGSSLGGTGAWEADDRRFYATCVMPFGETFEAALNQVVRRYSGGRLRFRWKWQAIEALQPQMGEKIDHATKLAATGLFTRNELNERYELGFEDNDDFGDEAFMAAGMSTTKSIVEGSSLNGDDLLAGLLGPAPAPGPGAPPPGAEIDLLGDGTDDPAALPAPDDQDPEDQAADDLDLARAARTARAWRAYPSNRRERARFWRATVAAPLRKLENAANGRIRKHFTAQRGRVIKALGKGDRRAWLPPHARIAQKDIDRALAAYQVGGLGKALLPVCERAFVDGAKSAKADMARARRRMLSRATGDVLQGMIDQVVADGKLTAAEAKGVTTEQELDEKLAAKGYGTAASGARFGDAIETLNIPADYAPQGTQQIKLDYFDPRLRVWTQIDERIRDAIGESLRDGMLAGETLRELKTRVSDLMDDVTSHSRTRTIARTETGTMRNGGRADYMRQQGVETVEWLAEQDERTRDSHAEQDGVQVRLGEPFPNGLTQPCEIGGPPEEVINCRCTLLPIARGLTDEQDAGDDEDWQPERALPRLLEAVRAGDGVEVARRLRALLDGDALDDEQKRTLREALLPVDHGAAAADSGMR